MEPEIIITHVASSSLAGQEQRFRKPRVTIGRAENNDVAFDYDEDLLVSHKHAELYVEDGLLYLRDLASRNGTYVNQRRITTPVPLHPEDAIHLGDAGPLVKARLCDPEAAAGSFGLRDSLLGYFFPKEKPKAEGTAEPPQQEELAPPPLEEEPAPQPQAEDIAEPQQLAETGLWTQAEGTVAPPQLEEPAPRPQAEDTGEALQLEEPAPRPQAEGTAEPLQANGTAVPLQADGTAEPPQADGTAEPPQPEELAPPPQVEEPEPHPQPEELAPPPQADGTAEPLQLEELAPPPQEDLLSPKPEQPAGPQVEDVPTPPPETIPTPETEDFPTTHEDRGQWRTSTRRPLPKASRPVVWPLLLVTFAIAFCLGVAVGYRYLPTLIADSTDKEPSEPADVEPIQYVAALGHLEPDGGILNIGGPAGQTLKSLLVKEGQFVNTDDELAHLSSYDSLQAEREHAHSVVADATEQLKTTQAYSAALVEEARKAVEQMGKPLDLEIQTLEAEIELLQAHLDIAVKDRENLEKSQQGANSEQLSRQKLVEQRAERELTAAEKRLEQLRESAESRRAQAQAQLETAKANQKRLEKSISVESAEKNVERAEAQLDQAIIRAPVDGKVLKILAREGANVGGRAILQLGETQQMNVIAEVYETDVCHVQQGQTATISSDALPEELHGTVQRVLWTIERNTIRDINPTAPEDLRVVKVKIRLDEEDVTKHHDLLEKLINLQVHVRIKKD